MAVQPETTAPALGAIEDERSTAGELAERTRAEASNVASTAADGARGVAGEVRSQAQVVAGEARQQLEGLLGQTRDEVRQQAEQRNTQVASGLRTLSEQLVALAEGRSDGAGPLIGYVHDAEGQVRRLAKRLEEGGPQGVMDDVSRFARRRPGLFLAAALGAGFVIGRAVRATAASQSADDSEQSTYALERGSGPATGATFGNGQTSLATGSSVTEPQSDYLR